MQRVFLESEIRKLELKLNDCVTALSGSNIVSKTILESKIKDIRKKISDYNRDIAEVETLKTHEYKNNKKTEKEVLGEKLNKVIQEIKEMRDLRASKMAAAEDEAERRKQENRYSQIIDELEAEEADIRQRFSRL